MKIKAKTKKKEAEFRYFCFFSEFHYFPRISTTGFTTISDLTLLPPPPSVSVYIETNLKIKIQYSIFILRSCSLCEQKKAKKPDRKCNLYKKLEDR